MNNLFNQTDDLKSIIENGVSYASLTAGKHRAVISSIDYHEPNGKKAHYRISLLINGTRPLPDNRFDKRALDIFCSQVKGQLNMSQVELKYTELFDLLIGKEVDVWVSYVLVNEEVKRNINYSAPKDEASSETSENPFF